jgi:hypothetical protein
MPPATARFGKIRAVMAGGASRTRPRSLPRVSKFAVDAVSTRAKPDVESGSDSDKQSFHRM